MFADTASYQLKIKGQPTRTLGPDAPTIRVGRAAENDWVIEDQSLSRRHAQFEWSPDGPALRDLGSRFGTSLNGVAIQDPVRIQPGDQVIMGTVLVEVSQFAEPSVRIEPEGAPDPAMNALAVPAASLRGSGQDPQTDRWNQVLETMNELTLGLIQETPPQRLLEHLLEKLMSFLGADRGAVLLVDPQGTLAPEAIRVHGGHASQRQIRLSRTLVEAALERREAILLTDPAADPQWATRSLILSGITSAIITPLETEGQVSGLLYADSRDRIRRFTRDDLQLATILAHVAAAKIHAARLMAEAQRTRTLEHEMGIARDLQLRMLPRGDPGEGPFELCADLRPAKEVGGDLYDYQWHQGQLRFCIGDVCGKGVPAALVMALTKTLFRANGAFLDDPAQVMAAVNALIYEETGPGIFVSAFFGRFDPASGRLAWCNAGHEPPILLAPGRPARFLDTGASLALGVLEQYGFRTRETLLAPGEGLLLYTDGVTEAVDDGQGMFGRDRLLAVLDGGPEGPAPAVVKEVLGALERFTDGAAQADDITLLCLRHSRG
jgi:serine phosphatase RsbU (regulator of sigma subunit)